MTKLLQLSREARIDTYARWDEWTRNGDLIEKSRKLSHEELAERLSKNVPYDELFAFCDRNRINYYDYKRRILELEKQIKLTGKEEVEIGPEKSEQFNEIVEEMKRFNPAQAYGNEFPYQVELIGFLKSKFPGAVIEQQRGSSRPDIVIDDIAIEVKGPTGTNDLITVADKCMRYRQYFNDLIVILFETRVYEPRYAEWLNGMETQYPGVIVIRK